MKKILLLFPRLDCSFKEGYVPTEYGPVEPIREHWNNFRNTVVNWCFYNNVEIEIDIRPLWQFNSNDYANSDANLILVPHKEVRNFDIPGKNIQYYMQCWDAVSFSCDWMGWGSNQSWLLTDGIENYDFDKNQVDDLWVRLQNRIDQNISKFDQPDVEMKQKDYVLFLTQLPHDETILYHSQISVYDALLETMLSCKKFNRKLIVKSHPLNPSSQEKLRELCELNGIEWNTNVNIHSAIQNSLACVTVNSGTGFEVMLHEKTLYAFGDAEYSFALQTGSLDVDQFIQNISASKYYLDSYRNFMYSYYENVIDSRNWRTIKWNLSNF